ncbi:hypothetical protein J4N45_10545 [Vibrio sp. SCSIO 43140]|uniref:hypothetical protein n=1 Tax=Vibrio sp. SCSIO 43140 TaxID=2819100 RepID=UPI002074BA76|nr:hypothetical protein [Vibrio sp. SCSIO 43140]USD58969.1 hypothetical protein J4N45_10545 [Vibrio sp. SCSIO 43140]
MDTAPVIPNGTFTEILSSIENKLWDESIELSNLDKEHLRNQLEKAFSEISIQVEK